MDAQPDRRDDFATDEPVTESAPTPRPARPQMAEPPVRKAPKPFSAYERMLAWRYLRSRRREAAVSVVAGFSFLGITIGVAALVVVMAVMNGFRGELLDRILGIEGHVVVQPIDPNAEPLDDYAALGPRIEGVEGVTLAVPMVKGYVGASSTRGGNTFAAVRGVTLDDLNRLTAVSGNIVDGDLTGFASGDGVVVGLRLAQMMGIAVGEGITLIHPEGDVTPFGTSPRVKTYPVTAMFELGDVKYDQGFVFMPMGEAQAFFNMGGAGGGAPSVSAIDVFTEDADAVEAYREPVEAALGRSAFLTDWKQANSSIVSALAIERNAMFMILSLIVIVAALNILSGLIMLVKDKGRDVAILRTMGATRRGIMRVFLMTGSAIGLVGTIAGFLIGLVITLNIEAIQTAISWLSGREIWDPAVRRITQIPAEMDASQTVSILVMALVLSFLATIFPAWRAAKLDPVDALRYE